LAALTHFEAGPWGQRFPEVGAIWRRHWEHVAPLFLYPLAVRRLLCSTHAIESVHMQLRKGLKVRGHFSSDEAAGKLIYMLLRSVTLRLGAPPEWRAAMRHVRLLFGARVPATE